MVLQYTDYHVNIPMRYRQTLPKSDLVNLEVWTYTNYAREVFDMREAYLCQKDHFLSLIYGSSTLLTLLILPHDVPLHSSPALAPSHQVVESDPFPKQWVRYYTCTYNPHMHTHLYFPKLQVDSLLWELFWQHKDLCNKTPTGHNFSKFQISP